MIQTLLRACAFLALPAVAAGTATAQGLSVGPGSTVPGDILRGQAAMAVGAGIYTLNSAEARSIDANTAMALSQFTYNSMRQHNRDRQEKLARQLKHSIDVYKLKQSQLRDNPDYADLLRGDTLNIVLQDLWDPEIPPSDLRSVMVLLPVSSVHALPFQVARMGGVISRRTLTVDNGNGWPVELKTAALDAQRKAYLQAVDTLLELNMEEKLTLDSIRAVQKAIDDLKAGVERTIPQTDRFYIPAQGFLRELSEQARLVESGVVRNCLADIEKYHGTTVADLVEFMRWYNLRFAPAKEGSPERELYPELYEALVAQRDQLAKRMGK